MLIITCDNVALVLGLGQNVVVSGHSLSTALCASVTVGLNSLSHPLSREDMGKMKHILGYSLL